MFGGVRWLLREPTARLSRSRTTSLALSCLSSRRARLSIRSSTRWPETSRATRRPHRRAPGVACALVDYSLDGDVELEDRADGREIDYIVDPATGRLHSLAPTAVDSSGYHPTTGQLNRMSRLSSLGTSTLDLGYDGSLFARSQWSGSPGMTSASVDFAYDSNFWITGVGINGVTAPWRGSIAHSYDDDGDLISAGGMTIVRNDAGLPITATIANAIVTQTWNEFGEQSSRDASYASTTIYSEDTGQRDALGRFVAVEKEIADAAGALEASSRGFDYDLAGRLERVRNGALGLAQYTYDANGNRTSRTTGTGNVIGVYDGQDRLVQYCPLDGAGQPAPTVGLPCLQYTYRDSGELLTKLDLQNQQTTSYEYDERGALTRVVLGDGRVVSYEIDALGRRIGKRVNGIKQWGMVYRDGLRPAGLVGPDSYVIGSYVYGTQENVPDVWLSNNGTYRFITDHLGSVRVVINVATGVIVQRMDYDEFGNVLVDTNPGGNVWVCRRSLRRCTGLVRFGARDYDAVTGRWTARIRSCLKRARRTSTPISATIL